MRRGDPFRGRGRGRPIGGIPHGGMIELATEPNSQPPRPGERIPVQAIRGIRDLFPVQVCVMFTARLAHLSDRPCGKVAGFPTSTKWPNLLQHLRNSCAIPLEVPKVRRSF